MNTSPTTHHHNSNNRNLVLCCLFFAFCVIHPVLGSGIPFPPPDTHVCESINAKAPCLNSTAGCAWYPRVNQCSMVNGVRKCTIEFYGCRSTHFCDFTMGKQKFREAKCLTNPMECTWQFSQCVNLFCSDTCQYASDGICDPPEICGAGDCTDCGPALSLCTNTCPWSGDGICEDGGVNYTAPWIPPGGDPQPVCSFGSDCEDCGPRLSPYADPTSDMPNTAYIPRVSYDVEFTFLNMTDVPPLVKSAVGRASERWHNVITGGLAGPASISAGSRGCLSEPDTVEIGGRLWNSLVIYVRAASLDVGILGMAGPCRLDMYGFPRTGLMLLDIDKIVSQNLSENLVYSVVSHEIAHVMGFGSLWGTTAARPWPLTMTTNFPQAGMKRVDYIGHGGIMGNSEVGAIPGYPRVEPLNSGVSVSDGSGPPDLLGAHWRAKNYPGELMTPVVTENSPLSILTLRALTDLGYKITAENAEPYTITDFSMMRRELEEQDVLLHHFDEHDIYIPTEYGSVELHDDMWGK